MKVILIKKVIKVGNKFDIKEVSNGYARNFLLPNKLAIPVTEASLRWLEIQKEQMVHEVEEGLEKIQSLISKIDGQEITIPVKVGDKDQLFESINQKKISEKLEGKGFDIKKEQIDLKEPIKNLGEYNLKIMFDRNLEAEIKVLIINEES